MIKLQAKAKPVELTDELVAQLTAEYKSTDKAVWQKPYITKPLLAMSHGKCCFCETKINEESKYMEVEHFHPKKYYQDEVVLWENLLPICKRCNGKKSDHDSITEPLIHPVKDNPKEHLKFNGSRLKGLTLLGKLTVKEVYLNDGLRLVTTRFKVSESIIEKLIDLLEKSQDYINNPSNYKKNRIIDALEKLMLEGTEKYEYSATAATTILSDENYQEIRQLFIDNNLWNDNFIELEQQVNDCALL
ncbi:MAG: hypothetical protein WAX77_06505 [Methylococcaceae bacterium]